MVPSVTVDEPGADARPISVAYGDVCGSGVGGHPLPAHGGAIHIAAALTSAWFFRGVSSILLDLIIAGPLGFLGIAYWVGRPEPRRWAAAAVAGLPLIAVVAFGAEPALRVAGRVDDGNHAARRVTAAGVDLIWAPEGPG